MAKKIKAPVMSIDQSIASLDASTKLLRSLRVQDRAGAIISMHAWVVREFAELVLEYAEPETKPKPRRRR